MTTYVKVEYVDTGAEYGFFGKVVATSDIRGMSDFEIVAEVEEMTAMLGEHISARYVEELPAV